MRVFWLRRGRGISCLESFTLFFFVGFIGNVPRFCVCSKTLPVLSHFDQKRFVGCIGRLLRETHTFCRVAEVALCPIHRQSPISLGCRNANRAR